MISNMQTENIERIQKSSRKVRIYCVRLYCRVSYLIYHLIRLKIITQHMLLPSYKHTFRAGLRSCGTQLFSVKSAVCCCVYLNSREYITLARGPNVSNWSKYLRPALHTFTYLCLQFNQIRTDSP
jgi:hypothetical protein